MNASVVVVGVEKPFGQQVDELAQALARARRGSRTSDPESAGRSDSWRASSAARCRARRAVVACVAAARAPTTRSYSPSRATMRRASSGGCWPSASMISTNSPLRVADAGLHRRAVALVVRMADDARAGLRARASPVASRRAVVDDEDLAPGGRGAQLRDDVADGVRFVHRRDDDRDRRGVSQAAAPRRRPR